MKKRNPVYTRQEMDRMYGTKEEQALGKGLLIGGVVGLFVGAVIGTLAKKCPVTPPAQGTP